MKFKSGYVTSDNQFFDDSLSAARHELRIKIMSLIEEEDLSLSTMQRNEVAALLVSRAHSIASIALEYDKNLNIKTEE